jgi:hypothetical protein
MNKKSISLVLVFTMFLSSCGISFQLPQITPGPVQTENIEAAAPSGVGDSVRLVLSFGAGDLNIQPGSDTLVSGQASFNIPDFKPEITYGNNSVSVKQGSYTLNKLPNLTNVINNWNLALGSNPMDLEITAGAYSATMNLGGLALTNLTIKDGASDVHLSFSDKNLAQMNLFRYETGASQVNISGLSNADFSLMEFSGGAGNYVLDFSGELNRDATASITAGLGNIRIVIPQIVRTQLTIEGNLTNINIDNHWDKNGNTYTQNGTGPMLTIIVKAGAANLIIAGE